MLSPIRKIPIFKLLFGLVLPLLFLVFIFLCSRIPSLAEWYMQNVYPAVATLLSGFSRLFPFSVLDILILSAIMIFAGSLVFIIIYRISFLRWLKVFVICIAWVISWFYLAWGISYFRPDFHKRFGVEAVKEDQAFFEDFVIQHISRLNDSYVTVDRFDADEIDRAVEETYHEYYHELQIPYPCGTRRTKFTAMEGLMTGMGVAGFFDPFFNEVQVNNFLLPASYPFTLAHEKAHQFGIASESECNLYASIICTSSRHPLVRYSGHMQTVSYLLGSLRRISPDEYARIFALIDPRIIADYKLIQDHWQKAIQPQLSEIQDKVYDSYLKTNKQQSGIRSYSEMVGLLLAWEQLKTEK